MMRSLDTSVEARAAQLAAYREMRPEERLHLADQMSAEIRALARAGIQARSTGDISPADVEAELARIMLGEVLATAAAQARTRAISR